MRNWMAKLRMRNFSKETARGEFYPMFLNMTNEGFETEAMIFMLSTWNFARFRYAIKNFDLDKFIKALKKIDPFFKSLEKENFETIDIDKHAAVIKKIFSVLAGFKGIEKTGAPKLMHLKVPQLFVMWDAYIRNYYKFKKGDAQDYIDFLRLMQKEFPKVKKISGRTTAKLIDEHNYITITKKALSQINNN